MPRKRLRRSSITARVACRTVPLLAAVLAFSSSRAHAQEFGRVEARVNYVYATQFGFGGYEVGGLRVDVYSLPIGITIDDVLGDWDLQVDLPVTYGSFRFSDTIVADTGETAFVRTKTNTIGVDPTLQLDIPIPWLPGFRISPIGAFGFGTTFSSSASIERNGVKEQLPANENAFYTYQIGLSSVYQRDWRDFSFFFGNAFIYGGNATLDGGDDDAVEGYGTFRSGVEARHPLGFRIADVIPDIGAFFVYHLFTPNLEFTGVEQSTIEIDQIFEVGGTIGVTEASNVSWLPGFINRAVNDFSVGVGYQTGKDLEGFRLTFGFPF
jgi:hypothetical protein